LQPKDRYDSSDFDESHYESGSRRRVLKTLLGITNKREMDQLEGREQVRTLEELAASYDKDHQFTAADVRLAAHALPPHIDRQTCLGSGRGARRTAPHPSVPRRERKSRESSGCAHGVAGGVARSVVRQVIR
jgi:hypothetical protein